MGSCLSKKNTCSSSSPVTAPEKIKSETHFEKKKIEEENPVKKEIFIIKHRKSHEIDTTQWPEEEIKKTSPETCKGITFTSTNNSGITGATVRTSSCTKEEVDAILIQCGRLSRSSSTGKTAAAAESGGRKYSGSKRSYDFDNDGKNGDAEEDVSKERENRHRHRQSPSHGRRRTPSREREREQQRSGSRERGGGSSSGSGGRRMSRSPAKRSESPNSNIRSNSNSSRPGKMVSVPATISTMGGGGEGNSNAVGVKRIQVKRNVGGGDGGSTTRTTASPRARSPARMRGSNEQQQQHQPMSLSRSNSRKAEHSPYRRNPLSEIDTNIISQAPSIHKPNAENKINSNTTNVNHNTKEQQQQKITEENNKGSNHVRNVICTGPEIQKPHTITRSRSSRLSRDLEELIINSETPSNSNNSSSSYTALLLEDIQNFHQKNTTTPTPPSFSFPPCLTKACSILDAVADLNSTTSSENRLRNPIRSEIKDDKYLESEIVAEEDDFMKPSFHKYVTVRRGTIGGEEFEEQESEGSNSFAGSQQQWISPLWEPNSVDSTDRWTSSSSRSVSRGNDLSSGDLISESKSGKRSLSVVTRGNSDNQLNGIGRGRVGVRGGTSSSMAATVSN
ncbi:hypothetical protein RD792_001122 [Penstemon davidsonii]|uniref:Uncharacterized protein n=1 Tax=Penstemon davidsonii TaxID=160366 RepID=A0ABR0DMJ5_9LAMI|nr:hypothetical protein RD792_001122 [Penstemon davidsonii]